MESVGRGEIKNSEIFSKEDFLPISACVIPLYLLVYWEGLKHLTSMGWWRSALGEAVAHAPPVRRGARLTPWGYAPMESSGNGCLWQPMETFFYCDSHESQQQG